MDYNKNIKITLTLREIITLKEWYTGHKVWEGNSLTVTDVQLKLFLDEIIDKEKEDKS